MNCCVQAWLDDIKNILVLGLESLVPLELFSKVEQGSINHIFFGNTIPDVMVGVHILWQINYFFVNSCQLIFVTNDFKNIYL